MKKLFWLTVFCLCSNVFAQNNTQKYPLQVGFGLSGVAYVGDLTNSTTRFQRVNPGANLSLQLATPRLLDLQVNGGFGKFSEQVDDGGGVLEPANSFVETQFFYGDLRLKLRFLKEKNIQPYLSAGAGIIVFAPRDVNGKHLTRNQSTRNEEEKYNTAIPQLPVVVGWQMILNQTLMVSMDYTYRFTPTDYLDNIGQLGPRKGFDVLHALQISLYFTLNQGK
ncbi:MAG: outer membrane beta-barrel protein [Bacteroidetes bacterium]|nr:outer membrane beta-barrel protein [Bacteroidota bacterium]MCB0843453.1 outer membrane beta-barrel protein [Bacteroidota bacterium]